MNNQELATLWCALNGTTGPNRDEIIREVMGAIKRRVGKDAINKRWRELDAQERLIRKAVEEI